MHVFRSVAKHYVVSVSTCRPKIFFHVFERHTRDSYIRFNAKGQTTVNRLRWLGYLYHVTNHLIQPGVERSRDAFPASNFNCLLTISKVGARNSDCIVVSFSFWSDFFAGMAS